MGLMKLEHGSWAYRADFALYGAAVLAVALYVVLAGSPTQFADAVALVAAGVLVWSLIEYALHRFVMHGLQPFRRWHALHHERPTALICLPTALSGGLITGLVFLPSLAWGGLWKASAFTLGVLAGYLVYGLVHHATHHVRAPGAWLRRRKRWHALHHHHARGRYGVTSGLWDHVFGSAATRSP